MKLDMDGIVDLARFVKASADAEDDKKRKAKKKNPNTKPTLQAYPDYGRSLVTQRRQNPHVHGLQRAAGTATMGAVLGALMARMATKNPRTVAQAAGAGAIVGGVPGYISGDQEARSDYTKLLALRRTGIQTPAEYEQSLSMPDLTNRLTTKGVRI